MDAIWIRETYDLSVIPVITDAVRQLFRLHKYLRFRAIGLYTLASEYSHKAIDYMLMGEYPINCVVVFGCA